MMQMKNSGRDLGFSQGTGHPHGVRTRAKLIFDGPLSALGIRAYHENLRSL